MRIRNNIRWYLLLIFNLVFMSLLACGTVPARETIAFAGNGIIAHRGAWKYLGLPENSIASLKQAIALECTGSEFDVRMTADEILVVNHDKDFNEMLIEETKYEDLLHYKLSNGESLPTLEAYLLAGMEDNTSTGLVCEIKPSKSKERGQIIAKKGLDLVNELKAEKFILSYISFDYAILQKIKELDSLANVQYLDGSKSPEELKEGGISGLDYEIKVYKKHQQWIENAKGLGLALNVWTVNKAQDLHGFIEKGFNYITTNEPELMFTVLEEEQLQNNWELVWSDEFNYSGKVDSTKWHYEYGFLRNNEKQYYTDSLTNVSVENGNLIITARKEKIANKDFGNSAFKDKSWLQYITNIDTAQYTSGSISTKGLAAWTYGKIEVRAKLPGGVGLWPAIWMLGVNRDEVGWPTCGEIDIMEYVGYNKDSIFGTVHTMAYNHTRGTQKGKKVFIENPQDQFHIFAIEWTPEKIDFLLDGVVYNHFENEHKTVDEWPFDKDFYLKLNVAVGGSLGGKKGIDKSVLPQQMLVDYVRVYQLK